VIGPEQTGGLALRFGDAEAMLAALRQIVTNNGVLGQVLSQGSAYASQVWGPATAECLITVKNEEAPAHMPQAKKSLALIYAVNPFGADHQSSEHDWMYEDGMASPLYLGRLAELDQEDRLSGWQPGRRECASPYTPAVLQPAGYARTMPVRLGARLDTLRAKRDGRHGTRRHRLASQLHELMKTGARRSTCCTSSTPVEASLASRMSCSQFFKPLGREADCRHCYRPVRVRSAIDLYYQLCGWTPDGVPAAPAW
jgi:aldehyde:ferredoxin oxidoreductase